MTEEQIIQNAEEHATKYDIGRPFIHHSLRASYIEGAHSRDKEIEQLQHELAALSKVKAYALNVGNDVREDIRIFRMAENYLQEFLCIKIEEDEKNRYNNNMYGIRYENEDITDAYQQGMRDAYDNPKNPWISVKDEKPAESKDVIFMLPDGLVYRGFRKVIGIRDRVFLRHAPKGTCNMISDVAYWMPISEPNKTE